VSWTAKIAIEQMTNQPNFLTAIMALQAGCLPLSGFCAIITINPAKMSAIFCCNWLYLLRLLPTIFLKLRFGAEFLSGPRFFGGLPTTRHHRSRQDV
jgi:hypothetical protein